MQGRSFTGPSNQSLIMSQKSSGNFQRSYGASHSSMFKGFTTNVNLSGVPHYETPLFGGKATSATLNPYGPNTLHEGIPYGTGMSRRMGTGIDPTNARPIGYKTPLTFVGWGYDIFGYPAPNYDYNYRISGCTTGYGTPSGSFWCSGLATSVSGKDVPNQRWLAGPVDLQWDLHRKVWTSTDGCYPARVFQTFTSGNVDPLLPQFAERVAYSARTMNGARQCTVTSGTPIDKRPPPGSYFIQPLVSGDPCFIVLETRDGECRYSLMVFERYAPSGC